MNRKWLVAVPLAGEQDLIVGDRAFANLCRESSETYFGSIALLRPLTVEESTGKKPIDKCLNNRLFDHARKGLHYQCPCGCADID